MLSQQLDPVLIKRCPYRAVSDTFFFARSL